MRKIRVLWQYITENFVAEQSQWFAWVPFLFGTGIALYFSLPQEPNLWFVLGVVEAWLLLFYICRNKNLNLLFISGLIVICGFVDIQMRTVYQMKHVQFTPKRLTYLSGQITDISASEKGKQRFLLNHVQNWDEPLLGQYRITNTGPQESFHVGECVELIGTVFPPSRIPLMAGFQLDRKYFYDNISGIGYANSEIFKIKCPTNFDRLNFKTRLNKIRQNISTKIAAVLPPTTAGIADALLIGEKSKIPAQITNNYRGSGLAHFLAVSGLHLGTIAGLVFFLVRWLLALFPRIALRIDSKKPAAIIAILSGALYLLISGMAVPAERAFIMTTVVLIGIIFDRQAISMRMVCFAALVILVLMPQALISISFQMSFAAVYALVAFYEKFSGIMAQKHPKTNWFNRVQWYLLGIVIADLVASLATAPMAIYHFKQLAIYTSLGNLLAGPIIGLYLMPLILLCLVSLPFGLINIPLKALGWGLDILNRLTSQISSLPNSLLQVPDMPLWGFLLIICGAYWLCVWHNKWRLWGLAPIVAGILSLTTAQTPIMLVAPHGEGLAVRNKDNNMVLLPIPKVEGWLQNVWRERWKLQTLRKDEYEMSDNNCLILPENMCITCTNGKYNYQSQITFTPKTQLHVNNQKVNWQAGGYIYEKGGKMQFVPLWNVHKCRRWQPNYSICAKRKLHK